ncbi:MAG: lipoprotein [Xanthobacteraceae bacterium]|nr:lipoprotein [Xanthobacteraceae bacterium]
MSKQNWARVAAVAAIAAALGLSACGRKGPLDLPPGAAQHSAQPASEVPVSGVAEPQPGLTRDGKALAPPPRGDNRSFILDWLVQ